MGFTVLFKRPAPAVVGAGRLHTENLNTRKYTAIILYIGKKAAFILSVFTLA
jgi:hypothetical protein